MKGSLVKWIHEEEATNLCVIMREYTADEICEIIEKDKEVEHNPLFLVYDFITNEYFYALEEELHFLQRLRGIGEIGITLALQA